MKIKHILFLPLIITSLASCGGRTIEISREVANTRVAEAILNLTTEEIKSLAFDASLDLVMDQELKDNAGVIVQTQKITANGLANIKAKNLDQPTAEFAAKLSGSFALYEDNNKHGEMSANIEAYYVNNFTYLDATLFRFDGATGQSITEGMKQKTEVGPFPGLPSSDDIPELDELPTAEEISALIPAIGTLKATESKGILTVRYEISQADLPRFFLGMMNIDPNLIPEEELNEILDSIAANIADEFLIRKAVLTVKINKAGFISGLAVDVDVDIMTEQLVWNESLWDYVAYDQKVTVNGTLEVTLAINEPVNITYPDFGDYVLVRDIVF